MNGDTVAFVAIVLLIVVFLGYSSLFRSLIRQQARERETLTNQIMHLSGRTWQEPPSTPVFEAEDDPDVDLVDSQLLNANVV